MIILTLNKNFGNSIRAVIQRPSLNYFLEEVPHVGKFALAQQQYPALVSMYTTGGSSCFTSILVPKQVGRGCRVGGHYPSIK